MITYRVYKFQENKYLASIKEFIKKEKRTSLLAILFMVINIICYISLEELDNSYSYRKLSELNLRLILNILEVK